ncbi:ATP-grasp domain-containing protein [Gallaecimonas sp. GXIMD4217]|uniref:ATP-grasp domain-containing protein n=1 Tax=Gallaecimonas sp. GXIMD4217 TaxID=3131927 RepID=UPI00311B1BFF
MTLDGRKALLINLGWEQRPYLDRLLALGVEVYGVHHEPLSAPLPGLAELLICPYFDTDTITAFARRHQVEAVISDQCDYALFASAVVSQRLGLPGPGVDAALKTTNKYLQRQALEGSGIRQPQYRLCLHPDDVLAFGREQGYPLIVKPVDARGSFGVSKVTGPAQAAEAFWAALAQSPARQVICERFIHGTQLTVDGFCLDGIPRSLAVASKGMLDEQRQVAVDIHYPARIAPGLRDKALANNDAVARALGLEYGFLHGEYMLTDDGELYLIELANRGGGCHTSTHIIPAISGINVMDALIYAAFGQQAPCLDTASRDGVLLKFFRFERQGRLLALAGWEDALAMPGVLTGRVNLNPGDAITDISNDANRHGFFIVAGPEDSLHDRYQAALARLRITVQ